MPDVDERLALAEQTMTALVADAELPPKIGVHPRPDGSFAHAMPAHLRGTDPGGGGDLLGMKWVAGFGRNNELGLPAINAVVVINDAATGLPTAILDGGPITALRTAAVSGVAIRHFAPAVSGRAARAALIGAGVQGHSHLAVLGRVLPGVALDAVRSPPGAGGGPGRSRTGDGRDRRGHARPRRACRRAGCRRRRDGGLVRAGAPGDDRGVAGCGCARRPGRLRHVPRRRGRARRGALPGRRPRPVPREP